MKSGRVRTSRFGDGPLRLVVAKGLFALVVAAIVAMPSAFAQEPPPRDFATWLDAVNTHVPGLPDEPVRRVAPWPRGDLEAVLSHVSRQEPDERLQTVERALVLHTDIAMVYRRPDGGYSNVPPGTNPIALVQDGRAVGQASGTFHWELARRLLDRLPRGEERSHVGRRFYRATAALLQSWGEYPELNAHLAVGQRLLGDDAVLLMYEGTRYQAYASPKLQRFLDEQRRTSRVRIPVATGAAPGVGLLATPPGSSASLTEAERLFRRAIAIDPTLVEARIRLAHVLSERGRHDAASTELTRVTSASLPPLLDYYASLVAGRVARAREAFAEAQQAFERAAAIYPHAPAPRFGLSELAIARGDRAASLEHLTRVSSNVRVDDREPWWRIERTHAPSAAELIVEMRNAVRR